MDKTSETPVAVIAVGIVAKVGAFLLGASVVGLIMATHRNLWFLAVPVWAIMFLALRSAVYDVEHFTKVMRP